MRKRLGKNAKLDKVYLDVITKGHKLLTKEEYFSLFEGQLKEQCYVDYFERETALRPDVAELGFLKFDVTENPEGECFDWVPGGAWPGGYARYMIDNPENAPTTQELLISEQEYEKHSLYALPGRLYKQFAEKLIVTVDGQKCQSSNLTKEMLAEALNLMTPAEKALHLRKQYRIDISLYATAEFPVRIRLDGVDDGAEEVYVTTVKAAQDIIKELAFFNSQQDRKNFGFQTTD